MVRVTGVIRTRFKGGPDAPSLCCARLPWEPPRLRARALRWHATSAFKLCDLKRLSLRGFQGGGRRRSGATATDDNEESTQNQPFPAGSDYTRHPKRIMIQGTASSVGKSLTCAALCRIFSQQGLKTVPFKSQNMGSNTYITRDGGEISRAQAVQAEAAGVEPSVLMNPVLLKPSSDAGADVVVLGKPMGSMDARDYHEYKPLLRGRVQRAFEQLAQNNDVVVIEGAGSPAEINLREHDFVNMGLAEMVNAPVIIVGDIDRGGVFASLLGTVMLMCEAERARVKGFIINKFRGDISLLKGGLDAIEGLTGIPVLGVIPHIRLNIDDEDSLSDRLLSREIGEVDVAVARFKHISNFTDFTALERFCTVRYVGDDGLGGPDALILPGTMNTRDELSRLKSSGLYDAILEYARRGGLIFGVCGGLSMLGREVLYGDGAREDGLGLIDMRSKISSGESPPQRVLAATGNAALGIPAGESLEGFETDPPRLELGAHAVPYISAVRDGSYYIAGAMNKDGSVLGVNLHGIFENEAFTHGFINALRRKKGLGALRGVTSMDEYRAAQYDKLADHVRAHVDIEAIRKIMDAY